MITEELKFAEKIKDFIKIEQDLDEGYAILNSIYQNPHFIEDANNYINRINNDYAELIAIVNVETRILTLMFGESDVFNYSNICEKIVVYLRFLRIVRGSKTFDEVVNFFNKQN